MTAKKFDWASISTAFAEVEQEWYAKLLDECPPAYHTEPDWDLPSVSIAYWQIMYDIYGWVPMPSQALIFRLVGERSYNGIVNYNRGTVMEPRQNGKTVTDTCLLYGALTYLYPGSTAIFTERTGASAQDKIENDIWPLIMASDAFVNKWKPKEPRTGQPCDHRLKNGSRLYVPSSSANPGRGATEVSFVVTDEILDDKDGRREASVSPTMAWSENPQLVRTSTPGYDYSGQLRRLVSLGRVACGGEPLPGNEDDVLERIDAALRSFYIEFSAPAEMDWQDEETWKAANPAWNYGINLDVFRADFDSMDKETFCREHLGQWADEGLNPLISRLYWDAIKVESAEFTPPFALGLDSPPSGSNANVALSDGVVTKIDVRREGIVPTIRWVKEIVEKYENDILVAILRKSQMARVGEILENDGYEIVWYDTAMYAKACQRFKEDATASGRWLNDDIDTTDEEMPASYMRIQHHYALDKANNVAEEKMLDLGFKTFWPKKDVSGDISALIAGTLAYDAICVKEEDDSKNDPVQEQWREVTDEVRTRIAESGESGEGEHYSIADMWGS